MVEKGDGPAIDEAFPFPPFAFAVAVPPAPTVMV
jgi:hypothetical protein